MIEIDVDYVIELVVGVEREISIVHSATGPVTVAIID